MAAKKKGDSVQPSVAMPATGNAGKSTPPVSKKITLCIPREMDYRLYCIARTEGVSKAELAIRLLDQGLQRFGFDEELRLVWAKLCRKAGEAA